MFATSLTLLTLSLLLGDVTVIPAGSQLIAPGKLNWLIADPVIPIPEATRAIVTRIRPEGLEGVVEVKLWDGTDRLGWMEDRTLVSVRSQLVPSTVVASARPPSQSIENYNVTKPYGDQTVSSRKPRRGKLPDFSAIDSAMASMSPNLMSGGSAGVGNYGSLNESFGGYYQGPRQPPGHYVGGFGSSHAGGHYVNSFTGNHYQKR